MSEATIVHQEHAGGPESGEVYSSQYLTFGIAGETYAIGVLQVKEILRFETITTVPGTLRSIRGVINLRGAVVPVVDLAVKFGLPAGEVTKWSCIVIVEVELGGEQTVMGVVTDSVNQVVEFLPGDIEPPPPFGTNVKTDYLTGMGKDEKKFVLILDIDRVLSAEEFSLAASLVSDEEEALEAQGPNGSEAESPRTSHGETDESSGKPEESKAEATIEAEAREPSEAGTTDSKGKKGKKGGSRKAPVDSKDAEGGK